MNELQFIEELKKNSIYLTQTQLEQFKKYIQMIQEWNKKFNLTSLLEEKEIYLKHFYDCLVFTFDFKLNDQFICDLGAGAGFPSIVLKIVYPNIKINLIDSSNKKIFFLNEVIKELNLNNIQAFNSRIEDLAIENKNLYDIVTARAVANLSILLEIGTPLIKVNGHFIALKGSQGLIELENAKNAMNELNLKIINNQKFILPYENSIRYNLIFEKTKSTNIKYPRNYSQIKKKPL